MKDDNKVERILATVGEGERREIKGLIKQLEANGARLVDEDVRMLVSMTTEERCISATEQFKAWAVKALIAKANEEDI